MLQSVVPKHSGFCVRAPDSCCMVALANGCLCTGRTPSACTRVAACCLLQSMHASANVPVFELCVRYRVLVRTAALLWSLYCCAAVGCPHVSHHSLHEMAISWFLGLSSCQPGCPVPYLRTHPGMVLSAAVAQCPPHGHARVAAQLCTRAAALLQCTHLCVGWLGNAVTFFLVCCFFLALPPFLLHNTPSYDAPRLKGSTSLMLPGKHQSTTPT